MRSATRCPPWSTEPQYRGMIARSSKSKSCGVEVNGSEYFCVTRDRRLKHQLAGSISSNSL